MRLRSNRRFLEGRVRSHASQNGVQSQWESRIAATTMRVGVHIDASLRKAIRLPEDVRQRAIKMKERK